MATRKRNNGEGTISKRKDGRYQGQAFVLTSDGHRKRRSFYGQTSEEVVEKMNAAKIDSQRGIPTPGRSWRVGEFLDYWLKEEIRVHKRPLTYVGYESIVRRYIKPSLGSKVLHDLSALKLQEYINRLESDSVKPGRIKEVKKVLSGALTYAMKHDLVVRNVARLLDAPTYIPAESLPWSAREAKVFLDATQSEREYAIFLLFLLYGLRIGEVSGLRWSDIDFEGNLLHIRQQVRILKGGKIHQGPPKTNSSKRTAPLLDTAAVALREYRVLQDRAREAWEEAGHVWENLEGGEALILTTNTGRPMHHNEVRRIFKRLCEKNNIRTIKVHDLRRTATTLLKNLGVPEKDLMVVLGHSSLRTTGIYEHVDIDNKRNALERLESEFFRMTTTAANRDDCRQTLPSEPKESTLSTPFQSGMGALLALDVCRPGGSVSGNVGHRLQSVIARLETRARCWLVGCVAVSVALKFEQVLNGEPVTGSPFCVRDPASREKLLGKTCLSANDIGSSSQLEHDARLI